MPGKGRGINPSQLSSVAEYWGGVPFELHVQTVTGTSTYQLVPGGAAFKCRVLGLRGIMTGAGGAGDTIALQDGNSNVIIAAIDVSALSNHDVLDASTVDNTYWDINAGDNLKVITASDALAYITVRLINVEDL